MTRAMWRTVVGGGIAGLLAVVPAEAWPGESSTPQVSGTVKEVDARSKAITLVESNGTVTVTGETEIVKDGQRASLSDVREGDEVRASYSESGGSPQVTRIDVVGGPSYNDQG